MTVARQLDKGIFRIAVPSILANITVPLSLFRLSE